MFSQPTPALDDRVEAALNTIDKGHSDRIDGFP
jgi:hypothetical protein